MLYLDLDETAELFGKSWLWSSQRPAPFWFRQSDYLGQGDTPLKELVKDLVAPILGHRPAGPVRILTHVRTYGVLFNPITIYYCFDQNGQAVEAVIAEVTNTPWLERHQYVLLPQDGPSSTRPLRFRFDKAFHVSPFMGMDSQYRMMSRPPASTLVVHMESHTEGHCVFDATLSMQRAPITPSSLRILPFRYPGMPLQVIAGIYYQAFKLWRKGARFFSHPKNQPMVPR